MSQFIKLKQRIKTVETIKKTTHAMRLIAMSGHSRLKNAKEILDAYQDVLEKFARAIGLAEEDSQKIIDYTKPLVVLVGSQKGLSGSFNFHLFNFIKNHNKWQEADTIVIGKQLIDLVRPVLKNSILEIPDISQSNYSSIASRLKNYSEQGSYTEIIFIANTSPSFFIQRPVIKKVMLNSSLTRTQTDILFEQDSQTLYTQFVSLKLLTEIMYVLYESLLAEQAARFVSMDNATRNAENMLKTMKLDYNKLRQASITRELTDLIGSRLQD